MSLQKVFTAYGKAYDRPLIVMYGQTEATAQIAYCHGKMREQNREASASLFRRTFLA